MYSLWEKFRAAGRPSSSGWTGADGRVWTTTLMTRCCAKIAVLRVTVAELAAMPLTSKLVFWHSFRPVAAKRCVGRENVAGQKSSAMTRDTRPRWSGGHRPRRSRVGRENVIRADIFENIRGRTWRPYPRPIAAARPQQLTHDQRCRREWSAVANPPAVRPINALKVSKAAKNGSRKKLSPLTKRAELRCFVLLGQE